MSGSSNAVFLSNASQDAAAAQRIADALRAAGVEVWFDQNELVGGDAWDAKIRGQIAGCALFVPVISANTQAQREPGLRTAWALAAQRARTGPEPRAFLCPVAIDSTPETEADVPPEFFASPWVRVPGADGQVPDGIADPGGDVAFAPLCVRVKAMLAGSGSPADGRAGGAGSEPAAAPLPVRLADYELLRRIGEGGYGEVWLARGLTGAFCAVKIVRRNRFPDTEPFEREFRGLKESVGALAGRTGGLALLHVGRDDAAGFFYYAMELADDAEHGRAVDPMTYVPLTAKELRRRRGRLPAAACRELGEDLAAELAALHARGLVHRDIKPSNIILVNGRAKLADIGLVASASEARTYVGTAGFVPPDGPGTPSADVYALGRVLYELATGFDRTEFPKLPAAPATAAERKELFELNEILLRAGDSRREARYRDGSELQADFAALGRGRSLRNRRAGKVLLRWAAVAAVLAGGAAAWERRARPVPASNAGAEAPAAAAERSVVVLPFANLSEQPADAYFARGVHAEVVSSLAEIAQLRVVSGANLGRAREGGDVYARLARELGVVHVLEGEVQRAGDRVRVSGRLIRAATGAVVWAGRFDRTMADVFAIQSELSQAIAGALAAKLPAREGGKGGTQPTKSLAAYDLYLKGRSLFAREDGIGPAVTAQIEDLYTQAVGLDPDFAEAWIKLANIQILRGMNVDGVRQKEQEQKARASLEQVARLAPDSADLERELGLFFLRLHKDYDRALRHFRAALRLKPDSPWALAGVAMVQRRQGDWAGSTAMIQRALKLDPGDIPLRRGLVQNLELRRHYAEAAEQIRRIVELFGDNVADRYGIALNTYFANGDPSPVVAFFAGLTDAERTSPEGRDMLLEWAGLTGNFAEVVRLDRLAVPVPGGPGDSVPGALSAAMALAALGDGPGARARLGEWPRRFRERKPDGTGNYFLAMARAGRMEAMLGNREQALEYCRRSAEGVPESADAIWGRAIAYDNACTRAWLGDRDAALAELARLLRTVGALSSVVIARSGPFFPLRDDPRFVALMADPATREPLPWNPGPDQPEPLPTAGSR